MTQEVSGVVIRDATSDDLDAVIMLANEMYISYAELPDNDAWESDAKKWLSRKLSTNEICIAVAQTPSGEIVSSGVGLIYDEIPQFWLPNGKLGLIRWMSTFPEHRGQGLGDKVLAHIQSWFISQDVTRVTLNASPDAVSFYKRNDYVDTIFENLWWAAPDTPGFKNVTE